MDGQRVQQLLELLRQRTSDELTLGVMALAPSFTPEMWRALELFRLERTSKYQKKASRPALVE